MIDVVLTYVDGNDPVWLKSVQQYTDTPSEHRYRDWGTLKILIKSIRTYMKYVRNIYLVVSSKSQVQDKNISGVRVITHDQIIPSKYLPTFNSCTIEMFLHNIPDLSEHFIYFNDDTYPIAKSESSDFFDEKGHPCLAFKSCISNTVLTTFRKQSKNSSDLARRLCKLPASNMFVKPDHICIPMLKSTYNTVWNLAGREIEDSISRFREDKNLNQYLFSDYNLFSGIAVQKRLDYIFLKTMTEFNKILMTIKKPSFKFICMNDTGTLDFNRDKKLLLDAFVVNLSETRMVPKKHINTTNVLACERINRIAKPATFKKPTYPIDLVFPYVDSEDPDWYKIYKKFAPNITNKHESWQSGESRFRSHDMLKYVFRSIDKNLPWINRVHMLVMQDSQVPSWIDRNKVHIVYHKDFIPEQHLPTFNASTIEMFIQNVPGLSNRFIYSNDDIFITQPMQPNEFFNGDTPIYHLKKMSGTKYVFGDDVRRNGMKLVLPNCKDMYNTQHLCMTYIRDNMKEFYNKHEKEINDSCSKFREVKNLNQYMFAYYQSFIKKDYIDRQITPSLVTSIDGRKKFAVEFSKYKMCCLNDSDSVKDNYITFIHNQLDKMFPNKSKFEL